MISTRGMDQKTARRIKEGLAPFKGNGSFHECRILIDISSESFILNFNRKNVRDPLEIVQIWVIKSKDGLFELSTKKKGEDWVSIRKTRLEEDIMKYAYLTFR